MVHTSATRKVSSSPKEQAVLKAWIRSLTFKFLGTVTVTGIGKVDPSVLNTVNVIVRVVVVGKGKDRYKNGSNVTEFFLQRGHIKVDRYCPCNKYNILLPIYRYWSINQDNENSRELTWHMSTIMESLRAKWFRQCSSATSLSEISSMSFISLYGLILTRFKSSWSPSSRKARNSYIQVKIPEWNKRIWQLYQLG